MLRKTKLCMSLSLACGSGLFATPALAQQELERVEVTGSAIRRIAAETTVPITIIRIEELKKQGVTTIEQVMANISSVQLQQGTSQQVGAGTGGVSFADLRALGANKTLVLLNGRRVANSAFDSSAPDLNTIPFAALERVEVLRDGASALYGSDAIGGVINFITRRSYTGGTLTLGADNPDHPGGKASNFNAGIGFGDIDKDRFNIFGFVDYQKQKPIGGLQRPFNQRLPGGLSPTPFPANYYQDDASGNPAAAQPGGCPSTPGLITDGATGCQISTSSFVDYTARADRFSGMLKGELRIAESATLGVEYFGSRTKSTTRIAPVPYGGLYQNRIRPDGSLNPFYPGNPGSSVATPNIPLDPAYTEPAATNPAGSAGPAAGLLPGFIHVKFRDFFNGQRTSADKGYQDRLLTTLQGTAAGWDYQGAVSYNRNRVKDYISGYSNGTIITAGVRDGVINPFGDQDAAGGALISSAGLSGQLQEAKGTVKGGDFRASRELSDWLGAGRPAAIAVGVEARHEKFRQAALPDFAALVIASTGIDPNTVNEGSRNVYAAYTELNVPVLKNLELTGAVRYDKYTDSGDSTNPKFSFRYEASKQVLLRGSVSTGFRAPSLYELNSAPAYTSTSQLDDPVRCPGGTPIAGAPRAANCGQQFQALTGGNQNLKPEKSRNMSLGLVIEPVQDMSVGLDYFWIRLKDAIGSLSDVTVFDDPVTFASVYHRLPNGSLSTDGSSCPDPATCGYVDLSTLNLGRIYTQGLDLSLAYRLRTSGAGNFTLRSDTTYVNKYKYEDIAHGPYHQNVNIYSGEGPIFRWQSNASVLWSYGQFGAALFGHYKSGYADQDPSNRVASYTTFDISGSYVPIKSVTLLLGVRNVFDRDPPYSNQVAKFQANYDPRFTDPTGRNFYVRGTYSF